MFDWNTIERYDRDIALDILGCGPGELRQPDLIIAPAGADRPYLYRWFIVKRSAIANVYFHIQVADDPERPLHDHPWDNQSVILAGGYREILSSGAHNHMFLCPSFGGEYLRKPGDVIWRKASWPHRLLMAPGVPYTMSLFSTGPKIREWGFWYPSGWVSYKDVTRVQDGVSVHVKQEGEQ